MLTNSALVFPANEVGAAARSFGTVLQKTRMQAIITEILNLLDLRFILFSYAYMAFKT